MSSQGDFTQAIRLFEIGLDEVSERMPQWIIGVHNLMTMMWIRLGQWARAQQASRAALACGDGVLPMYRARTLQLAGEIAAELRREPMLPAIAQAAQVVGDSSPRVAHQLLLARALAVGGDDGYALAQRAHDAARERQVPSFMLEAEVRCAQIALAAGQPAAAAAHARAALDLFAECEPYSLYRAEVWLAAVQALQAVDRPAMQRTLRVAVDWVNDTARQRVPAEFRDSFLNRNAVNRNLLTMATRLL
jgi:hypothetical protein